MVFLCDKAEHILRTASTSVIQRILTELKSFQTYSYIIQIDKWNAIYLNFILCQSFFFSFHLPPVSFMKLK